MANWKTVRVRAEVHPLLDETLTKIVRGGTDALPPWIREIVVPLAAEGPLSIGDVATVAVRYLAQALDTEPLRSLLRCTDDRQAVMDRLAGWLRRSDADAKRPRGEAWFEIDGKAVPPRAIVLLVGAPGAGKSTALRKAVESFVALADKPRNVLIVGDGPVRVGARSTLVAFEHISWSAPSLRRGGAAEPDGPPWLIVADDMPAGRADELVEGIAAVGYSALVATNDNRASRAFLARCKADNIAVTTVSVERVAHTTTRSDGTTAHEYVTRLALLTPD